MNVVSEVPHKPKRRVLGFYWTLDTGEVLYVARRKHKQIFKDGKATISGALLDDKAAWSMDEALLYSLRAKGIKRIGVRVEDTGDFYIANLGDFFDRTKATHQDETPFGKIDRQRCLRLQHFQCEKAPVVFLVD